MSKQKYHMSRWALHLLITKNDHPAKGKANSELLQECFRYIDRIRINTHFWGLSRSRGDVHINHNSSYKNIYLAFDNFFVAGETKIASGLLLLLACFSDQLFYHVLLQFLIGEQAGSLYYWNPQRLELLLYFLIISLESLLSFA